MTCICFIVLSPNIIQGNKLPNYLSEECRLFSKLWLNLDLFSHKKINV